MDIITNLQMLRQLMPDPKDDSNQSKYLDDNIYASLLLQQGVEPFYTFVPTAATDLRKIKKARIQAFYIIAGDEELVRMVQEEMEQNGEWNIYAHIRFLKLELSRLEEDLFGL